MYPWHVSGALSVLLLQVRGAALRAVHGRAGRGGRPAGPEGRADREETEAAGDAR